MNTATLGNFSLAFAVLASGGAVLASIWAGRFKSSVALSNARWLVHTVTALLTIAGVALVHAILSNDFSLEYVVRFSEIDLPVEYKLSALWAGHEGSLLLWAWMMAAASSAVVILGRKDDPASHAPAIAVLGVICGLFGALMLFTSNPFALGEVAPGDGGGMNPMLQHWAMIAHPPTLFLGYAGFAVPFALALGAMIGGRTDNKWIAPVRRWVIGSWLFLTIGIVLGSWWAYVELGWGGYWAWDPVENASLLPWLTGTALMHSLILQQRRGTLKVWNAWLIPLTFLLCIFGTYLTRSGVIASVHAFPDSSVGKFFLMMLMMGVAISIGVIIWRRDLLKSERKMDKVVSYEGGFIASNILLTIIMLTTMVGTIFPLLSKLFIEESVTLGEEFYNTVVVPMALLLAALMAIGPLLRYANAPGALAKRLIAPGVTAIAAAVGAMIWAIFAMDLHPRPADIMWAMACAAVAGFTVTSIVEDVVRTAAPLRLSTIRRWSGQLVHLGMIMIVVGVAGSAHSSEKSLALQPGQAEQFGRYKVRLDSLKEITEANYMGGQARIGVSYAGGDEVILLPERRQYNNPPKTTSEVAVNTGLLEDVYIILAGWKDGTVHIKVIINPLLLWIWIGGIAMSVGSLVCLVTPSGRRSKRPVEVADPSGSPPPVPPAVPSEISDTAGSEASE
ncbi:MAG: heme lyase CcmF/NrfE family subunit [Phycisphaerae bacterium]|jgi:cytochrome c-type biogenesis protein CcmF|nr:heme lyase CcmF/NrfE family subunit [Phycisphaerae bacterium]